MTSTGTGANIPHGQPAPTPPPLPPQTKLRCPKGQHVDVVQDDGDNGSCDCAVFCASDWTGSLKAARPHWVGATTAIPGSTAACQCVQATHWCEPPDGKKVGGCGQQCDKTPGGKPAPRNYCVPDTPPPGPSPPGPSPPKFNLTAFPVDFVEAPALFERKGVYYAIFGHCCCFCYQGSGMFVFTALHPLGPWVQQPGRADIGCVAGDVMPTPAAAGTLPLTAIPQPGQGCLYNGVKAASPMRSQQNFIIQVETAAGTEYVWTGDRWMQAPDGVKGHEPQYWTKLVFDDSVQPAAILPLSWVDEFTLNVTVSA